MSPGVAEPGNALAREAGLVQCIEMGGTRPVQSIVGALEVFRRLVVVGILPAHSQYEKHQNQPQERLGVMSPVSMAKVPLCRAILAGCWTE